MERRYNLIDTEIKDHYFRITWWPINYWYKCFGWKGLFSWTFSFANLKKARFEYDGIVGGFEKPGFQICVLGLQFGWLYIYND